MQFSTVTAVLWIAGGVVASFLIIWVNPKLAQLGVSSLALGLILLGLIIALWKIRHRG